MPALMPYQAEGVAFALKHRNALIADEMGLGKTVQAIGYINSNAGITSVLIVCPKSLVINWGNEIHIWLERKEVVISVIHYDALAKANIAPFDLLIVDEAHFIKNPKTIRSQEIKKLLAISKRALFLTGTPIENKVVEFWPILQLLKPEVWDPPGTISKVVNGKRVKVKVGAGEGANFFSFAKAYCDAKKVAVWKKDPITKKPKQTFHWDFTGASNLEELNDYLKKTGMIRRLKKDVLPQLPPKIRQVIELDCSKALQDDPLLYGKPLALSEENWEVRISNLRNDKIAFTEWSKKRHEQGIAKTEAVAEHVTRCINEGVKKIILFCHHNDVMLALCEKLVFFGIQYINAEMSSEERQMAVDVFNEDPNCQIIIGTIGTMGVGYTMTIAELILFAEIDPVPTKLWQAEDRGHRIGLEHSLLIQYLVYDGTIDARICKLVVKKQNVIEKVLGA